MKRFLWIGTILLALTLVAAQCGTTAPAEPAASSSQESSNEPEVVEEAPTEEPVAEETEEAVEEEAMEEAEMEEEEEAMEAESDAESDEMEAEASEDEAAHSEDAMAEQSATCDDPFGGASVRFSPELWTAERISRFVGPELVDPASDLATNFCLHSIDYADVLSGGPPPDGIPPIDDPNFDSIEVGNEWLADVQPVIALEINGDARAYPLAILTRHEIANDEVGGVPVAVTFCPLCNAGVVFNREVNGEILRFGVSGNLRNSDLIMWDNKTLTWWQQFTGQGIVGELTDTQLEILPAQMVAWKDFKEAFPEGTVLSNNGRNYGVNPYSGYDSSTQPFLFLGTPDPRLLATQRVLGYFKGETAVAYPLAVIAEAGVVEDTIDDQDVVVFYEPGQVSALDKSNIEESKEVGSAALFVPDVDGQALTFSYDNGTITDNETGSEWDVFGRAISGELSGAQLEPVLSHTHFWFAWAAFRPDTRIFGES
ncbi:MAG: DUF3179 domain-containing protein [Chloroflexota bacterium]